MKIRLCFNDKEYLEAFRDVALIKDDDIYIEISNNHDYVDESRILVTDYMPDEIQGINYSNTVFLSNDPHDCLNNIKAGDPIKLFKYNSLSSILADIHQINFISSACGSKTYDLLTDVYAITTDSFVILSSDVSRIFARQLLSHGFERILIVSLKAMNEYVGSDEKDRSRFIRLRYYQEIGRPYSVEHFVYKDNYGISYLRLPAGLNPIAYMGSEEIVSFIRNLGYDGFDTIILDIGNELNRNNIKIAEMADRIIFYSENQTMAVPDDLPFDRENLEKLDIITLNRNDDCLELKIDNYVESLHKNESENLDDEKSRNSKKVF